MNRSFASAAAATLALRSALRLPLASELGGLAALLDDARQLALVLGGEQGNLADVVQVQTDGVVHDAWYNRSWWGSFRGLTCRDVHSRHSATGSWGRYRQW